MSRFKIEKQIILTLAVILILLPQTQSVIGLDIEDIVPFTT